jgi:hypothetical protein
MVHPTGGSARFVDDMYVTVTAGCKTRYYQQYDLSVSVIVYCSYVLLFCQCWSGKTRYEQ